MEEEKLGIANQDITSYIGLTIPKGDEVVITNEYVDATGVNYDISNDQVDIHGVPERKIDLKEALEVDRNFENDFVEVENRLNEGKDDTKVVKGDFIVIDEHDIYQLVASPKLGNNELFLSSLETGNYYDYIFVKDGTTVGDIREIYSNKKIDFYKRHEVVMVLEKRGK